MEKLAEIKQRWDRMGQWRYNLGRMEKGYELDPNLGPWLVLYSDRKPPVGYDEGTVSAMICGPLHEPETLEDAIAYQEAPDDIAYLLGEINILTAERDQALETASESYGRGYSDGKRSLDNANEVAKL